MSLFVSRDWRGQATVEMLANGYPVIIHHSRDYTRDQWTALVEVVTGSRQDRIDRENLRRSPREQR